MTSQEHINPSQRQAEQASPASILERSMQEARRIRMDALAAAERNHAVMTAATQAKCDEMLLAAQRQAEAVVEAARFEAERVRAEVATASHATVDGVGQTSAQMILEISLTEAQQMLTKATDEAERVREYLVADAQATAMETIRQAEVQAATLMRETALQLDVVREQARQIYERLGDVTRGLQLPYTVGAVAQPSESLDLAEDGDQDDAESEGREDPQAAESPVTPEEEEDSPPTESQVETMPDPGIPAAPQGTSKPAWVIDLRSPASKSPLDPPEDSNSSSEVTYAQRDDGDRMAQSNESQTALRPGVDPNASGIRRMLGR